MNLHPTDRNPYRRGGPVLIGKMLPGVMVEIFERNPAYKRLSNALDILGNQDFESMSIEDKLDLAALFQEKSICSPFEAMYATAQKVKVGIEKKSSEYFRMIKENTEKINQLNRQQEAAYLSRRQK
jgi:hypothetical protein